MASYDQYGRAFTTNRDEAMKYRVADERPTHFIKDEQYKRLVEQQGRWVNIYTYDKNKRLYYLPISKHRPLLKERMFDFQIGDIKLRDYQQEVVDRVNECIQQRKKGLFVVSGTATGKTICILGTIKAIGLKTVLVVPNRAVRNVNITEISQHTSCEAWVGSTPPKNKANVYVMTAATFNKVYDTINGYIDVLLLDESHRGGATRRNQINMWKGCFVGGYTATPYRKEFREDGFQMLFGEYFDTEKTALPIKVGVYRYYRDYTINEAINASEGYAPESPEIQRNLIVQNAERLDCLIKIINNLWSMGYRRYIVFSDRVDHIKTIYDRLNVSSVPVYTYYGGTTTEERDVVEKTFTDHPSGIIVGHPASCGEGFNVPSLEVAIMFTSTSREGMIEQIAGRVRRYYGEKTHGLLVDFVDEYSVNGSKTKVIGYYERKKVYNTRGRETFSL